MTTSNRLLDAQKDVAIARRAFVDLVALADSSKTERQSCVSQLCEWLRFIWREDAWNASSAAWRDLARDVVEFLGARLTNPSSPDTCCGLDLDLSETVVRDLALGGSYFTGGIVDFHGSWFVGGTSFAGSRFVAGKVIFDDCKFFGEGRGGTAQFSEATFEGAIVSFNSAVFRGGWVRFDDTRFTAGEVRFNSSKLVDTCLLFVRSQIRGSAVVSFVGATFLTGSLLFTEVTMSGGKLTFGEAGIYADAILDSLMIEAGVISFDRTSASSRISLKNAKIIGGLLSLAGLRLGGGEIRFDGTRIVSGELTLDGAKLFSGSILLGQVWLLGGSVSFAGISVAYEAVFELPWSRYEGGKLVQRETAFDGSGERDFYVHAARYVPGVIRDWGPFHPDAGSVARLDAEGRGGV